MIVFPAIDLIGGRVVRLERGDRSRCTVYADDPLACARSFARQGAAWIHVVDLSAALGEDEASRAANDRAIRELCRMGEPRIDIGGGVRSLSRIDELAALGARRIALGTALIRDPGLARAATAAFGELLVADVAARAGEVRVNGWREAMPLRARDVVGGLRDLGFQHLVFTDIARDGMRAGIDAEAYGDIARAAGFAVVASGGIASLDDIRSLCAAGPDIVEGCIVGRALYEGAFTLSEALVASSPSVPRSERAGATRGLPC